MIIFPGQIDSYRSRSNGDRLMTISYYSRFAPEVNKVLDKELGTEYMIIMIPTSSEELGDFQSETPEQSKERFRKHMNSLINQVSDKKKNKDWREEFKKELIDKKIIKKSTTELSMEGYVQVIGMLNEKLYDK